MATLTLGDLIAVTGYKHTASLSLFSKLLSTALHSIAISHMGVAGQALRGHVAKVKPETKTPQIMAGMTVDTVTHPRWLRGQPRPPRSLPQEHA